MAAKRAHKCTVCKKVYKPTKIGQLYCSAKCCQRAYRARKAKAEGRRKRSSVMAEKPLNHATCAHCGGGFFAKTARAQFCSTSCRSLYHRYLKASLPAAVGAAFGVPADKALDLLELREVGKIREYLACMGYVYQHERRAWVAV